MLLAKSPGYRCAHPGYETAGLAGLQLFRRRLSSSNFSQRQDCYIWLEPASRAERGDRRPKPDIPERIQGNIAA
jgi:hypothetical protein